MMLLDSVGEIVRISDAVCAGFKTLKYVNKIHLWNVAGSTPFCLRPFLKGQAPPALRNSFINWQGSFPSDLLLGGGP